MPTLPALADNVRWLSNDIIQQRYVEQMEHARISTADIQHTWLQLACIEHASLDGMRVYSHKT